MSAGQGLDFSANDVFVSRFPVHRACRDGDVGVLVSLSEQLQSRAARAALTAEDPCCGWTPLHWAAHCGKLECVVRLVQMGCEVNVATSHLNQTPTHTAASGGHAHCVVWLIQAGADVNMQDFVGEAALHKAARSGSLDCIQVLLIAGAKPHVRNSRGQTAADLAHAHGFLDCFAFVSNTHKHLLQLGGGLRAGDSLNGNATCGQTLLSRKRPTAAEDGGHAKRVKRAENMLNGDGGDEDMESTNVESAHKLLSGGDSIDQHHAPSRVDSPRSLHSASPKHDNHRPAEVATRHSSSDMCGSLHLNRSPSSCVSQRPGWWGLMGAECGDVQYYGHYHGFGDTAEDLSDVQAEQRHTQAVAGTVHLYNVS